MKHQTVMEKSRKQIQALDANIEKVWWSVYIALFNNNPMFNIIIYTRQAKVTLTGKLKKVSIPLTFV